MAINTQKFLPLTKSSSAIVKSAGSNISTEKNKGGAIIKQKKLDIKKFIPPEKQKEEKEETYGAIVKSLVSIDKFLKSGLLGDKKTFETEKQEKKEEKSKEREKKLETKEKPKGLPGGISLPKFDFLESVKRYFLFTFLGWLFTNTQQYLPQLMKIVDIIKPVIRVAEFIFKGLLEGFIGFIDLGYKAYDTVRGVVKNLGGEGAQKTFDDLSKNLNTLITTTILVAGAIAALGGKSKGAPGTPSPRGRTPGPRVPRSLTGRPIPTTSGGRPLGRPDIRNPIRERPRVTETGGGRAGGLDIRNPLRQGPKVTTTGGARAAGRFSGKRIGKLATRGAPVIGPLLDFGIRTLVFRQEPGRAAAASIGLGVGQALGGLIGGSIGSIVGSVVPIAGTLLGGSAGVFIGQLIGGFVGDWIGNSLYDAIVEKRSRGQVQKKAIGGKVFSRKNQSTNQKRTLKIAPKKPTKKSPQKTQPGKDVGGEKKIQQLYAKPGDPVKKTIRTVGNWLTNLFNWGGGTTTTTTQSKKADLSAFELLVENAKVFKDIPVIGEMLSAGIEAGALGQAPSKDLTKNFAKNIGYLVQLQANQQVAQGMTNIRQAIVTLADGGTVPSRTLSISNDNNISDEISKSLEGILNKKIQIAIKNVSESVQEIYGKKEEKKKPEDLDMTPGNIKVTSDSPDFWLLVTAALFENGQPTDGYQGAADVAQAIYNRVALPGWPKTIRKVILAPGQFSPVGEFGSVEEWSSINSKEDAIAFAKKYKGYTGNIVERVAATLLDKSKQQKARDFVGPRDNFRNAELERTTYKHLDDSTEKTRYEHTFGFEPGGANIGRFKKGKLMPAEINKEVVTGKVEEMEVGSGYGAAGGKIAGELGRFMKKKGVVPGSIHRHPEHPPYSLTSGHSPGSLHYEGRAIDLGGNANEQGPILKAIQEFNKIKGIKPVQLFHAGNDPSGQHDDHVHVAYQGGGLIKPSRPNIPNVNRSAYYEEQGSTVVFIPIEKQVMVPVPMGSSSKGPIMFPSSNLNKDTYSIHSLSR